MNDPIARRTAEFLRIYDALRRRFRWTDSTTMRYAALGLSLIPDGRDRAVVRLGEIADTIKRRSSMFSELKGVIRYPLAALLLRRGGDPVRALDRANAFRSELKEAKFRGGAYLTIASFLMLGPREGREARPDTVRRARDLFDRMNERHRFLTDQSDLPMVVALVMRHEPVPAIDSRIESIYRALVESRTGRSNATQLAAQILSLGSEEGPLSARRFVSWRRALKRAGLPYRSSSYDEIALLALLPDGALSGRGLAATVRNVRGTKLFKMPKSLALSLAVGLHLGALGATDPAISRSLAGGLLLSVQQAVEAQQAAVIAACTAGAVAASSAN